MLKACQDTNIDSTAKKNDAPTANKKVAPTAKKDGASTTKKKEDIVNMKPGMVTDDIKRFHVAFKK